MAVALACMMPPSTTQVLAFVHPTQATAKGASSQQGKQKNKHMPKMADDSDYSSSVRMLYRVRASAFAPLDSQTHTVKGKQGKNESSTEVVTQRE
jgi:hypothetical protein